MIYGFGGRIDNDSNAVTMIDEENRTALTKGYINGEFVEFSGGSGGGGDVCVVNVEIDLSLGEPTVSNVNKTYDELKAAFESGKCVYANMVSMVNDTALNYASTANVSYSPSNSQIKLDLIGYTLAESAIASISVFEITIGPNSATVSSAIKEFE